MSYNNNHVRETLKLEGLDLKSGDSRMITCPHCNGGGSADVSLSLTRIDEGLLYNCYRDSCELGGGFISSQSGGISNKNNKRRRTIKKFTSPLINIPNKVKAVMYDKWRISDAIITTNGWKYAEASERIVMPVLNKDGFEFGVMSKKIGDPGNRPKSILYLDNPDAVRLHYPMQNLEKGACLYVVEDIISATRLAKFVNSVALLGTHLADDQVLDMLSITKKLVMCLDEDTWHHDVPTPVKHRNRYGLFFDSFELKYIPRDIKDMGTDELYHFMGHHYGETNT